MTRRSSDSSRAASAPIGSVRDDEDADDGDDEDADDGDDEEEDADEDEEGDADEDDEYAGEEPVRARNADSGSVSTITSTRNVC